MKTHNRTECSHYKPALWSLLSDTNDCTYLLHLMLILALTSQVKKKSWYSTGLLTVHKAVDGDKTLSEELSPSLTAAPSHVLIEIFLCGNSKCQSHSHTVCQHFCSYHTTFFFFCFLKPRTPHLPAHSISHTDNFHTRAYTTDTQETHTSCVE